MSIEENKSLLLRYYEAGNKGNLPVMDEIISSDFMVPLPGFPQPMRGPEGVKRAIMMSRASFPDLFITVNDLIAEGDKVVVVWTSKGTNTGPLMGMPPTNRQMMFIGIDIWRIAGGKIVENFSIEQPFGTPPLGS